MDKNNELKEDKLSKMRALIEAKKRGTNAPLPRKGRGQNIEDSNTVFGTKAARKVSKGSSHNSK